jgi:hypothetical protein
MDQMNLICNNVKTNTGYYGRHCISEELGEMGGEDAA